MEQMRLSTESNIFKRGVMTFEDYNYEQYNQYILVDPTKTPVASNAQS